MDNKNAISCEELINYMNEKTKSAVTIKSCGQDIDVRTVLPIDVFDECVNRIVEMLYDEVGNYMPNLKDFFIKVVILFAYTNVKFPSDFDDLVADIYDLVYRTSFYNDVVKVINQEQYKAMLEAVEIKINHINDNNIEKVNRQIAALTTGIENLGKQFSEVLGDISEDDVNKLLSAIENNTIDEGKLMKAYMNESGSDQNA